MVDGSITLRYTDGTEETTRAGELYHWPAGHVGWTDDGVTFVEFSPAAELRPVLELISMAFPISSPLRAPRAAPSAPT